MKQTKPLKESYPIPLMPYSWYIQENMRLNDEILHNQKTIGSPLPVKEQIAYNIEIGRRYLKSRVRLLF